MTSSSIKANYSDCMESFYFPTKRFTLKCAIKKRSDPTNGKASLKWRLYRFCKGMA